MNVVLASHTQMPADPFRALPALRAQPRTESSSNYWGAHPMPWSPLSPLLPCSWRLFTPKCQHRSPLWSPIKADTRGLLVSRAQNPLSASQVLPELSICPYPSLSKRLAVGRPCCLLTQWGTNVESGDRAPCPAAQQEGQEHRASWVHCTALCKGKHVEQGEPGHRDPYPRAGHPGQGTRSPTAH